MPILFMALIALGVFLAMGLMLFYAAYAEGHTPREDESSKSMVRPGMEAAMSGRHQRM
jgi:hypothetical protein